MSYFRVFVSPCFELRICVCACRRYAYAQVLNVAPIRAEYRASRVSFQVWSLMTNGNGCIVTNNVSARIVRPVTWLSRVMSRYWYDRTRVETVFRVTIEEALYVKVERFLFYNRFTWRIFPNYCRPGIVVMISNYVMSLISYCALRRDD